MSRGGRRFQIVVYEYLCPKMNDTKVKLFETDPRGTRPCNAVGELIDGAFDRDWTTASQIGKRVFRYWALDMDKNKEDRLRIKGSIK